MRKAYPIIFLLVIGLATTGLAAGKSFKATLSGSEVVPPVTTPAKGEATFELSKNGKKLSYKVTISDIENVTAAHIHMGKVGEAGPPLVPIKIKGKKGKASGKGTITSKDLIGSFAGKTVKDLVAEIEAGNTYLNVHTGKYPDGEIRGQIK
ncbi:MAG TPA: CHRD domain-containing protein [Thermodesulfovibrionales bacterium]|nr:CHRD domain-containing protein [Thermodesulfovibrionales bacterium]